MKTWTIVALGAPFVCGAAASTGCDKKENIPIAPAASSLAPSTVAPTAMTMKFAVDSKGTTSIDMPAPKEHIKATTEGAAGNLDVDLKNIAASRGEVKIDLSMLTTKTFGDKDQDSAQTTHARCWLDVADCEEAKLDPKMKEANRYAVYAIRSIESPSATDVTKVPATKVGDDEVRTITMTTKGELLVHGHKVDREAPVEVSFYYPVGGAPEKPKSMTFKTKTPLNVKLAEHDVKPHDKFGKVAKEAFNLLGTKVADEAAITLEIKAAPQS